MPEASGSPENLGTDIPVVLVVGDTLVDFVPDEDGMPLPHGSVSPKFGGAGANVAMVLSRLDITPYLWPKVGGDDFGDFLAGRLEDSDVDERFVQRDDDAKTTLSFVTHDDLSWIHVTSTILSRESSRSAVLDLLKRAQGRDCTISLDPNARPELLSSNETFEAVLRGALEHVDVVNTGVADLAHAGFDVDQSPEMLARAVTILGPHTVFLTLGADGSLCYGTNESPFEGVTTHPGYDVEPVDTTGAGDGFLAAIISSVIHDVNDTEEVLAVANAVGAAVTTRPGALTSVSEADAIRRHCGSLPWH